MSAEGQIWAKKRRAKGKKRWAEGSSVGFFGSVFCLLVFLFGGLVFAAEQAPKGQVDKAGPPRYRVFPLRYISAERGKEYLTQLGIGTASILPSPNTLLVTASAAELVKVGAVLELVDAEQQYVIKSICAVSEIKDLPSSERIASEVGDVSIGTFTGLSERGSKTRVIVDVHNGALMAIAPAKELEKITAAIGRAQNKKEIGVLQPIKPGESNEPNQPVQPSEPNQPTAPVRQAEPNQPSESKVKGTTPAKPQETSDFNEPSQQANEQRVKSDKPDELELLEKLTETKATIAEPNKGKTAASVAEPNKGKTVTGVTEPNEEKTIAVEPNKPTASADSEKVERPAGQPQESKEANKGKAAAEEVQPQVPAFTNAKLRAELVQPQAPQGQVSVEPQTEQEANETEEPNAPYGEPTVQSRSYEPEPLPIGEEELTLDLPEKLSIIDLLDLVGKYLKLDYMYDPAKVAGEVTLKLQGPIKVRELYPLTESVLKFRNFVMTRKGNLVTIVPAGEVLDIDPTLMYDEKGKVEYGDVIVTRLFNLRYIDTASAMALLTQMKLGANITEIKDAGTLIVTDYAYRMGRVEELLSIIDKPGAPKQFKSRQLKYTMAKTLAPKVKTLMEQLGAISITIAQPAAPPQPTPRGRRITPQPSPSPAPTPQSAKPTVYLDVDERTNRVLMIGFENELAVVDGLIDTLDVEQQDLRTLRMYDIQHVDAQEVRNKLQELGIISGGGAAPSGRAEAAKAAAPGAAPGAPPAAPSAATAGQGLVEEPQVVIIVSTNSLLVNATAEQHIQIAMIIGYADSETLEQAIPYEIYPLENQNPKDLAEVLQKLIQETVKDKEGKIQQVVKKQEDIEIVPDESTCSLIVYASRKNQEWIKKLIKTLDRRRPQVLIDVMLVGISEDDAFTYDLQLISKLPEMAAGGSMQKLGAGATALLSPFPFGTVKEATSILGDTGSGQGFYADRHIQALLTLMAKKGYGRVLARPKILVNDNEKGHIDTTKTIYIARSASTVYTTAAGVGTTTTAPISTSYTFDQFPSGIKLDITPHISEGSLLRLELKMSRSSQLPPAGTTADLPPGDKTEDNVETVVTVPDNSTIILGGIITLDQSKKNWKVPLLGDVPIVGGLFRKIADSSNQSKLYVFVKANILRPSEVEAGLAEDIKVMSEKNRAGFEKAENKFQTHQDFPGIKPKPIDPLNVLEAE